MRWVVTLSNGETIYEDDDRPGRSEPSAWKRLRNYCNANGHHIVEMWLQFRSNRVMVEPREADAYYLIKSAFGVWGYTTTLHSYIVGALVDGHLVVQNWKVPELVCLGTEVREVDIASPSLIFRKQLTGS